MKAATKKTFLHTVDNDFVDDIIVCTQTLDLGLSEDSFSFSLWLNNILPWKASRSEIYFSTDQTVTNGYGMYLQILANNSPANTYTLFISVGKSSTERCYLYTVTDITANQLFGGKAGKAHIVYTKTGNTFDAPTDNWRLYVNNTFLELSVVASGFANNNTMPSGVSLNFPAFRFLQDRLNNHQTNRNIDEFAIWKRTITTDEIKSLYNSGYSLDVNAIPSLSDVYRYFKFNKLYALGGGDYSTGTAYIREEVTNNNNYGQLVNFTNPALLKFF
jgi:hypothetical protein